MMFRYSRSQFALAFAETIAVLSLLGCNSLPGRPGPGPEVVRPEEVLDFDTLYKQNCSACHGVDGKGGAAISFADPVYLALIDDTSFRRVAANGVPGTPMPAFARSAGGSLTDQQIDVLVRGSRARWAKSGALAGATPPRYLASSPGDVRRGAEVYAMFCASCHGPDGKGRGKVGSIVDGSYLATVSDQGLRTTVIVGVPDLGAPDWRGDVPGRPMTDQQVSDVVAWLVAQRPKFPGQIYASASGAATGGSR
jgi:cytochrome c oxidase cbb3-type subunit III